jgi:glycosyltransferase involved in cell wall biosynthesis
LPGAARNLGAQDARGLFLAFIDADCVPEPGWLAAALTALEAGAKIVGGAIVDLYPFHPIAASDNLLQFADFPRRRPGSPATYFPACNLGVSPAAWRELGGFPGDLPAGEDVLFTGRAAKRWPDQVHFVPEMVVRHRGRTRLGAYWRHQETFGFYRGRLGLQLRPIYRQLGKHVFLFGIIVSKRLSYITFRTVQWNPAGLLRLIVLLPVLLIGLIAWAKGFQQGCLAPTREVA